MVKCRCCGRPIGERPGYEIIVASMRLTPHHRPIIQLLAAEVGAWVPNEAMWSAIYGKYRNGGPLWADSCISVAINRMKPALALLGLVVEVEHGVGGRGRRLVWATE